MFSKYKTSIFATSLFLIITAVFIYSVNIRSRYFGELSLGHHEWLTGSSLVFSKNWYRDGAINDRFLMLDLPRSSENPSLEQRNPYVSYLPGVVLQIFIIAKLLNQEPNPALVMHINLANHYLISLVLCLTIWLILYSIDCSMILRFLFSLIPAFSYLLLPGPLYWQQNVFFADQAVMLWFSLAILLEVMRDLKTGQWQKKLLNFGQAIIFFIGIATDWLFVFVLMVIALKRLLVNRITFDRKRILPEFLQIAVPAFTAIFILVIQVSYYDLWPKLISRFFLKTIGSYNGKVDQIGNFHDQFWVGYIIYQLGTWGYLLLWASAVATIFVFIFLLVSNKDKSHNPVICLRNNLITVMLLSVVPCFLQVYFFRDHSYIHDFTALKFSLPMSLIPFCVFPLLVLTFFSDWNGQTGKNIFKNRAVSIFIVTNIYLFFALYLLPLHRSYSSMFPQRNPELPRIGYFIDKNTSYKDLVFSDFLAIEKYPPQLLSYSMKIVYKIESLSDINKMLVNVAEKDLEIGFLTKREKNSRSEANPTGFWQHYSTEKIILDDIVLYKMSRSTFEKLYDIMLH